MGGRQWRGVDRSNGWVGRPDESCSVVWFVRVEGKEGRAGVQAGGQIHREAVGGKK